MQIRSFTPPQSCRFPDCGINNVFLLLLLPRQACRAAPWNYFPPRSRSQCCSNARLSRCSVEKLTSIIFICPSSRVQGHLIRVYILLQCYQYVMHRSKMSPSSFSQSVSLRLYVWIPARPSPPKSSWCFVFFCCGSRRSTSHLSGQSWSQSWYAPCPLGARLFHGGHSKAGQHHWLVLFFSPMLGSHIHTPRENLTVR